MKNASFFPDCQVNTITRNQQELTVKLVAHPPQASCPQCHTFSHTVHGHYHRHPKDLPWSECTVKLELIVTRYRCLNPNCSVKTFSALLNLVPKQAQRTARLQHIQAQIGVFLSANGGVELLKVLHMPCSRNTNLRSIKQLEPPTRATPRVLGVDDWAFRKGKRYGTILVDLEQHQVMDLLEDRSAEQLKSWLKAHPGTEIITRDRASEFTRAIDQAAPKATQVADRFHLIQNLSATVQTWLERRKKGLLEAIRSGELPVKKPEPPQFANTYGIQDTHQHHRQANRAERLEQYSKATQLNADGVKIAQISREIGVPQSTIHWWLRRGEFPTRLGRRTSLNAKFEAFIRERSAAGYSNVAQIHRDLMTLGFTGSVTAVNRFLLFVNAGEPALKSRSEILSGTKGTSGVVRVVTRVLVTPEVQLEEVGRELLEGICKRNVEVKSGYRLIQDLRALFLKPSLENIPKLNAWIQKALGCGVIEFERFARGLQRDFRAVSAGLSVAWSNAQTEGQVTKLKLIKRQRYGRAGFELLRRCVLLS